MLLAGAVVCIITIINGTDVTYSLELLLATLIIFYILGLIVKKVIQKVLEGNMFVKQDEDTSKNVDVAQSENEEKENVDNTGEEIEESKETEQGTE